MSWRCNVDFFIRERIFEDEEKGFELISRIHPIISNGFRKEDDKFDFNKDAGMFVCPAGLMVFPLRQANKKPSWNTNRQKILKQKPGKDIRLKPRILN